MPYDIEKEIQERVADSTLSYNHLGIIEKTQEQVSCLTNIVAALAQALIDKKLLTEQDLYNL